MANDVAIEADEFVVEEQRLGVGQLEHDQALVEHFSPLRDERIAADKAAGFIHLHAEAEAGFKRSVVRCEVEPEFTIGSLTAQMLKSVITSQTQAEFLAGLRQCVKGTLSELAWDIQLPSQLADKSHPLSDRRRITDGNFLRCQKWKGRV